MLTDIGSNIFFSSNCSFVCFFEHSLQIHHFKRYIKLIVCPPASHFTLDKWLLFFVDSQEFLLSNDPFLISYTMACNCINLFDTDEKAKKTGNECVYGSIAYVHRGSFSTVCIYCWGVKSREFFINKSGLNTDWCSIVREKKIDRHKFKIIVVFISDIPS